MMVLIMSLASLSGCFDEEGNSDSLSEASLTVSPSVIPAGEWVWITISVKVDMSVFFPYFLQDPGSMRAQITWWAVYAFLHMDQTPVPNEL